MTAQTEDLELACSFPNNSKVFTLAPKSGKRRINKAVKERKTAEILSIALSMLKSKQLESHVNGLFEGEMAHLSFDIKKPLREELNSVVRERGTSVCKILNQLAVAFIIAHHTEQHAIGNTKFEGLPVVIENLNVVQNVQSRPRRLIRNSDVAESEAVGEVERCSVNGCSDGVVGRAVLLGNKKEYAFCASHLRERELDRINWRVAS